MDNISRRIVFVFALPFVARAPLVFQVVAGLVILVFVMFLGDGHAIGGFRRRIKKCFFWPYDFLKSLLRAVALLINPFFIVYEKKLLHSKHSYRLAGFGISHIWYLYITSISKSKGFKFFVRLFWSRPSKLMPSINWSISLYILSEKETYDIQVPKVLLSTISPLAW